MTEWWEFMAFYKKLLKMGTWRSTFNSVAQDGNQIRGVYSTYYDAARWGKKKKIFLHLFWIEIFGTVNRSQSPCIIKSNTHDFQYDQKTFKHQ